MNSLAFQHPWALWALCLLPAVAWLALRGRRGTVHATGTLGLWRRTLETPRTEPPRARRTLPLSAWVALAALGFGIAALAHPTAQAAPRVGPAWTLVVDRSPSMYLPASTDERSLATLGLASAGAEPRSAMRLELAVRAAARMCESAGIPPESRRWRSDGPLGKSEFVGPLPPEDWFTAPTRGLDPLGASPTPFESLDRSDCIWVSDCEPRTAPLFAGRVCSGARAVPGPVAQDGATLRVWNGVGLEERTVERRGLRIDRGLPEPLRRFAAVWAEARGFAREEVEPEGLGAFRPDRHALDLVGAERGSGPAQAGTFFAPEDRVRFSATGFEFALAREQGPGWEPWGRLEDPEGRAGTVVRRRLGRVEFSFESLAPRTQDAAPFAVALGELLDGAVVAAPEVLPWSERAAVGEACFEFPSEAGLRPGASAGPLGGPRPVPPGGAPRGRSLVSWFAGAAALLALGGLLLASRGR